jgi:hypothetical protein
MIVEELVANALAMRVRIVSPAGYAHIWDVPWQEIAEPVDAVCRRPGLVAVPAQAVDGNDAGKR